MPALAPKSAVRDQTVAPDVATEVPPWIARASRTQPTSKLPERRRRTLSRQPFWLLPVGLGMILMLGIVIVGSVVLGWAQTVSDDLHYGRPRTFQMDAFVGHETGSTPSHFIALNLQGQIEIIELPGGDATHARMYVGPHIYGPGADLVPVTVRFVEGVQPHHPDMLILFSAIGWRDAAGWVLCGEHRRQNSSVESKVRECEGLIFGGKSCILDSVS